MNDKMAQKPPWVLVEGPGLGDTEFLGRWLLAAVAAHKALEEQRKHVSLKVKR
jgi:hypothetical protein